MSKFKRLAALLLSVFMCVQLLSTATVYADDETDIDQVHQEEDLPGEQIDKEFRFNLTNDYKYEYCYVNPGETVKFIAENVSDDENELHWQDISGWLDTNGKTGKSAVFKSITKNSFLNCGKSGLGYAYIWVTCFEVFADADDKSDYVDYTVKPGETKKISVDIVAGKKEDMTFEWSVYKDGTSVNLENEHGDSIVVDKINKNSLYTCKVTDKYGNEKNVRYYFRIDNELKAYVSGTKQERAEYSIKAGNKKTLSVDVEFLDKTGIKYVWKRGKIDDPYEWDVYGEIISGESGQNLTVEAEECFYAFEATDKYGNTSRVVFKISVDNSVIHNLVFDSNGIGTISQNNIEVPEGKSIGEYFIEDPKSDGYVFLGWSETKKNVGEYLDSDIVDSSKTLNNDCTLYAAWKENEQYFCVDVVLNNGNPKTITNICRITPNKQVELSVNAVSAYGGELSYSWSENNSYAWVTYPDNTNTHIIRNLSKNTLYRCTITDSQGNSVEVNFDIITLDTEIYSLEFDNNGVGNEGKKKVQAIDGRTIEEYADYELKDEGYKFIGWSEKKKGIGEYSASDILKKDTVIDKNCTYYAAWIKNEDAVKFWYMDYEYELKGNTIVLNKYIGDETEITVYKDVVIDGKTYKTDITHRRDKYESGMEIDLSVWATKDGNPKVTGISFEKGFEFPKDSSNLFGSISTLTKVDLSGVNTKNVENMRSLFGDCKNLEELDLSSFDTSSVTNMANMFYDCRSLKVLNISNFDTSAVTNMYGMFYLCRSLETLDVSGFNTSNVTDMGGMFYGCESLKELDVSGFNTSNVERTVWGSGSGMFAWCTKLEKLDLSSFNTEKMTNMSYMFQSCLSLKELNLSSFDTSNACMFNNMFYGCEKLEKINLSSFDTRKMGDSGYQEISQGHMFNGCSSLKVLDIRNFSFDSLYSAVQDPETGKWSNVPDILNENFLDDCIPEQIIAPANIDKKVELPTTYYDYAGNSYTELPRNQKSSIIITKTKPTVNGFNDVKDSKKYFYSPVYWAFNNGITKGTTATTFSPDNPCTRGQFVTFLWRLAGEPKASKETQFNDVKNKEAYYYKAVMWAAEEGITTGTGKGNFSPDDVCTRAQCVTFIYRAAGKPNVSEEIHNKYSFADVKKSDFSYDPVAWAASQNITTGVGNNRFAPNDKCNRGMLVTFLYRYAGE